MTELKVLDIQNIDDGHNFGVAVPTTEELINVHPGAASFSPEILCADSDWRKHSSDLDKQIGVYFDDEGCVPSSITHAIEMQLNAWIVSGKLPDETLQWLKTKEL